LPGFSHRRLMRRLGRTGSLGGRVPGLWMLAALLVAVPSRSAVAGPAQPSLASSGAPAGTTAPGGGVPRPALGPLPRPPPLELPPPSPQALETLDAHLARLLSADAGERETAVSEILEVERDLLPAIHRRLTMIAESSDHVAMKETLGAIRDKV